MIYDDNTRTVNLQNVRLVGDVTVSGDVRYADPAQATAILALLDASGGRYDVQLAWQPFQPADTVEVTGTFQGRAFAASIPRF